MVRVGSETPALKTNVCQCDQGKESSDGVMSTTLVPTEHLGHRYDTAKLAKKSMCSFPRLWQDVFNSSQ